MKSRNIHKVIGLILVLPMIGWTLTGLVFFIKPGYSDAYEQLKVKTYPIERSFSIDGSNSWHEVKLVKTILGEHLLVKTSDGRQHLNLNTAQKFIEPQDEQLTLLLNDAMTSNIQRYGQVTSIDGNTAVTSTGVRVTLYWDSLTISQQGTDTRLINSLYSIHYLQWTPWKGINSFLGVLGLGLLSALTIMGVRLYLKGRRR